MLAAKGQNTKEIMQSAYEAKVIVPGFNVPYLPMVSPIIQALKDTNQFGLIQVARLEWIKFGAQSPAAVAEEYRKYASVQNTRLHMDHVPVIDEDGKHVDYMQVLREALDAGFESLMVDGSRLPLEENIKVTAEACELAHKHGLPLEAELGAVMGHESGPLPPYEELFNSGKGFTDIDQAKTFAEQTGVDWLSIAIGNIHGAITEVLKLQKKVAARLDIQRIKDINAALGIPLVLHGGSGIQSHYIQEAIKNGITKINIGTNIRQPYIKIMEETENIYKAQRSVYEAVIDVMKNELGMI